MLLAVQISSYGCTWEVWRALKKQELLLATPRATLTLLLCSPNFPHAYITRYTHAKHEPILKCIAVMDTQWCCLHFPRTYSFDLNCEIWGSTSLSTLKAAYR